MPKNAKKPELPTLPVQRPPRIDTARLRPEVNPAREFNRASRHRGGSNKRNKG